jgi:hypothetical protein
MPSGWPGLSGRGVADGGFALCEAVECPHAAAAIQRAETCREETALPARSRFPAVEILILVSSTKPNLKTFGDVPEDFRGD